MSWSNAWKYAKGVAAKHGVDSAKPDARADDDLPMGARIGAMATLQKTPFLRAIAMGSLMPMLEDSTRRIKSISRARFNLDGQLYRYYFDPDTNDAAGEFLQVFQTGDGEIAEVLYCKGLTRIYPQTAEEQEAFTGEDGAGLGQTTYTISREQIESLGFDEKTLNAIFGEAPQIDYTRDAGDPSLDFVAPFEGRETRINDQYGSGGLEQRVYFMPYRREIGDAREYLLVSTNIVESRDGDRSKREINVDFIIGIPLQKDKVVVQ
jgi:hypothetical protein